MKLKTKKIKVAVTMLMTVAAGTFLVCHSVYSVYSAFFTSDETVEYHVEADDGDTVWSLCGKVASDKDDLRYLVRKTLDENHISNAGDLQPGQTIIIRPRKV